MSEILTRAYAPTLEVREDGRTIVGVAVPFNSPTEIRDLGGSYREQFAAGAFARTIAERGPSRVKLLLQHDDRRLPIGRAVSLTETPQGLVAELAVSKTPDGDTALELVRDGTLDGLSVSFRSIRQTRKGDLVTRTEVQLREISLTGFPAYDDARVSAVRSDPTINARAALALSRKDTPMNDLPAHMAPVLARRDELAATLARALTYGDDAPEAERRSAQWIAETTEELQDLNNRLTETREETQRNRNADALGARYSGPGYSSLHVTEQRTYNPADARSDGAPDFLRDLFRSQILQDPEATARLLRHGEEVKHEEPVTYQRAVSTGGAGAFVPPAYLTQAWAEYARAGRPTANLATRLPLPADGMTVEIPKITTSTSTGVQTAENAEVAHADIDETTISVPVRTIAGYVDVSRQSIERGTIFESVVMGDLAADYATRLDAQVLAGSGLNGQHLGILGTVGINAVSYTDASPSLTELWPKLASAVGQVVSQRFSGPQVAIVSPETWAWMSAALGSDGRPLLPGAGSGPNNALGVATGPGYEGVVGHLLSGLPVILDGNMPTNLGVGTDETRIVIADMRDTLLLEDPAPAQARFDGPGSSTMTVRLAVYGYSAFTAARQPKAISVVSGTGLITPAL